MKMVLWQGCVCVCTRAQRFEFCFLVYLISLEDLPVISRGFSFYTDYPSPRARSYLLQYPEPFLFPSSARMLPSQLYYAVIVFAFLSKMPFVTLEDLPLFQNVFSLCDALWSNRARVFPTLPYRWSLFSLPSFFSDTWNNQVVEKVL